ncbi:RagB/SusD family nutrient uptake outer membrane protein [Sphingobacterium spiritivorum]|uniref:RagB/SusD family nutrient uptake outer membrane protein n=1 Tax=Sphingobacterium spiritivorum TaxID=258 RepID=UPI003DA67371
MKYLIQLISALYHNGQKKAIQILFYTFLLSCLGCTKFLETTPQDFVSPTNYYTTKEELTSALAGVYGPIGLYEVYGELLSIQSQGVTDEGYATYFSGIANDVAMNLQTYTHNKINSFWQHCYTGIERANLLLENADRAKADPKFITIVKAEAKFMRGYYHFLLAQYFGGVPIKIESSKDPNKVNFPRATEKEVYEQILKDMTEAEPDLADINSPELKAASSRVSKSAAQGILARVCLKMAGYPLYEKSKYTDALSWAKKVQASGFHTLLTDKDANLNIVNLRGIPLQYNSTNGNPSYTNNGYAQIFLNEVTNRYDVRESIWEVDYFIQGIAAGKTGYVGSQIGLQNANNDPIYGRTAPTINAQQYLYSKYAPGDLRRDWAIAPYANQGDGGAAGTPRRSFYSTTNQLLNRSVGKWRREYEPLGPGFNTKPNWSTQINFPILRYADVLLMICEAEFMLNGPSSTAMDAINQVRRRAYGKDLNKPDPAIDLTAGTLTLSEIQDERARELCFEALRKTDLIRWGIYLQRMQELINFNNTKGIPNDGNLTNANRAALNALAGGNKFLLWPIPSGETQVNKGITQNPGY